MHWFPFTLFLVAWVVAALSWLYGVAECIGIWRVWPWPYRQGLCVVTNFVPESLARPANSTIELAEVKARADSAGDWYLRAPSPWLGLRLRTPFPNLTNKKPAERGHSCFCSERRSRPQNGISSSISSKSPAAGFAGAWLRDPPRGAESRLSRLSRGSGREDSRLRL